MKNIVNLLVTGESNEVVDYYPIISSQETKQASKIIY